MDVDFVVCARSLVVETKVAFELSKTSQNRMTSLLLLLIGSLLFGVMLHLNNLMRPAPVPTIGARSPDAAKKVDVTVHRLVGSGTFPKFSEDRGAEEKMHEVVLEANRQIEERNADKAGKPVDY